jgi:hypothetical protein
LTALPLAVPDNRVAASSAAFMTAGATASLTWWLISTPSWTTPTLAVAQSDSRMGAATPTAPGWMAPARRTR